MILLLLWLYRHIMPSNIYHINYVCENIYNCCDVVPQGYICREKHNLSLLHPKLLCSFCFPFRALFPIPTRCIRIMCNSLKIRTKMFSSPKHTMPARGCLYIKVHFLYENIQCVIIYSWRIMTCIGSENNNYDINLQR